MITTSIFLFAILALTIGVNSSPASLLQSGSNESSLLSANGSPVTCPEEIFNRRYVTAIDCLNLFTYILATEDHITQQTFFRRPVEPGAPRPPSYQRQAGSCELTVSLTGDPTISNSATSSIDYIMRMALIILGQCFLDNRPDSTHCTFLGFPVSLLGDTDTVVYKGEVLCRPGTS